MENIEDLYQRLTVSIADKDMVKLLGGIFIGEGPNKGWWITKTNLNYLDKLLDRWIGHIDKIYLDVKYNENAMVCNRIIIIILITFTVKALILLYYDKNDR